MSMPLFGPRDDPGASFAELLRRLGLSSLPELPEGTAGLSVPHATTCVALTYADGVVMAGDRRATSGNLISSRTMEKVLPADRHSVFSGRVNATSSPVPGARSESKPAGGAAGTSTGITTWCRAKKLYLLQETERESFIKAAATQ